MYTAGDKSSAFFIVGYAFLIVQQLIELLWAAIFVFKNLLFNNPAMWVPLKFSSLMFAFPNSSQVKLYHQ
jgi:hypothetical protein